MYVQGVRWDKGGAVRARSSKFFYGKGKISSICTGIFVPQNSVGS